MHSNKPPKRWINIYQVYYYYGRTIHDYKFDMKNKKRKPFLRSQKILLSLLFMLLAVITCTTLFSCIKSIVPVVVVDGWNMHYNVQVDTNGLK